MLSTPNITRSGKIEHVETYSNLYRKITAIRSCVRVSRKKKLLSIEELFLVEMLNTLDIEAIESSQEFCKRINLLYRFLTSLS
jgi:hypothetical protein